MPEGRRIFQELTVLDNLKLGAFTRKDKEEINESLEKVYQRFERLKMTSSMSELNNMYVTPKDIDETVKNIGFTISEALNIALEDGFYLSHRRLCHAL